MFSFISIILLGLYRIIGSPHLGGCCRFTPSCSEFALVCYQRFSFFTATRLTIIRLVNCRPGGRFGFDPVPAKGSSYGSKQ